MLKNTGKGIQYVAGDDIASDSNQDDSIVRQHLTHNDPVNSENGNNSAAEFAKALLQITASLSSEFDLKQLLQEITDIATRLIGAKYGSFFYVTDDAEDYSLYTISGASNNDFENYPLPRRTSLFEPTIKGAAIIRCDDVTQDLRYGDNEPYHGLPEGHVAVRSYMAAPVVSQSKRVIGALLFGHPETAQFSENHEWMISVLAAHAAVSIGNAQLYQSTRDEMNRRCAAENALKIESERTNLALEAANVGTWHWNLLTEELIWSERCCKIFKLAPDTCLSYELFLSFVYTDDIPVVDKAMQRALEKHENCSVEFRIVWPDSSIHWLALKGKAFYDTLGRATRFEGIIQDISHRKNTENFLKENVLRFQTLAETVPQLIWIADSSGRMEYLNPRWSEYTGLPLERLFELGWMSFIAPDDIQVVQETWDRSLRMNRTFDMEFRLRAGNSKYYWFLCRCEPLKNEHGLAVRWFGTCTNIDDQKRAEQTQQFFAELGERMRKSLDSTYVLQEAVSTLGRHLNLFRCAFGEVDYDKDAIIIRNGFYYGARIANNRVPLKLLGNKVVDSLMAGSTVVCADVATDPRTNDTVANYDRLKIRSFAAIPLIRDNKWYGVLFTQDSKIRDWEPSELNLLQAVAERTWLTWENARLQLLNMEADARQRGLLRDVLASVTEGKLFLCQAPHDFPVMLPVVGDPIDVSAIGGMAGLRNLAKSAATVLLFDEVRIHDLMTAVGEAAMNAVVHAGGGVGRVCSDGNNKIQVWIEDHGGGIDIESLPNATLRYGYTTAGSLGHGMKMMLQTADCIYLMTSSQGTTVVIEQNRILLNPDMLSKLK